MTQYFSHLIYRDVTWIIDISKHFVTFTFTPYSSTKPAPVLYQSTNYFHFYKGIILSQKLISTGEPSIFLFHDAMIRKQPHHKEPRTLQLFQIFPSYSYREIIHSQRVGAGSSNLRSCYNSIGGRICCWGVGKEGRIWNKTT